MLPELKPHLTHIVYRHGKQLTHYFITICVPITVRTPNYSDYESMHTSTHTQGVCLCAVCIVYCSCVYWCDATQRQTRGQKSPDLEESAPQIKVSGTGRLHV